ncbi:uncharacterized protein LOC116245766 isoform X2 [Nymphaea colorata]|uniref:uncharacterized protein LOC116245766 isoform X2 n=1 Tax=Nymphaea colorata TaxID=210225 RepID=UPI00129D3307|nr:uncharacterized protein LOC116245766 isoform X2 [Nymphaea colorata]
MDRRDWEGRLRTRKRKDEDDVAIQSSEQSKQPPVKLSDRIIHKLASPISCREPEGAPLVRRSTRLRAQVDGKPLKKFDYHKPKPSKPSHLEEDASPSSISASDNSNYSESGQDEFSQDFDLEAAAATGPAFPKRRQSERLKNRGATDYSATGTTAVGVPDSNASFNESPHEPEDDELCCFTCQSGLAANLLLLCDGDGCDLAVHTFCLVPPMQDVPEGSWLCPNCEENPSLTEDFKEQHKFAKKPVQSVVGRRWVCIGGDKNAMQEQCLMKWHSLSHHLDTWIPVEWLYQQDRVRFHNFRRMFPKDADTLTTTDLRKPEWFKIDRVIACRKKSHSKEVCDIVNLCHWSQQDGQYEYLVKWKGLEYSDATWETSGTEELLVEFNKLVQRHRKANEIHDSHCGKLQKFQLTEQPYYLTGGILFEYQIFGVNWILSNFQIRRNVILADEMGLGKTIQVISFVCCMKEEHLSNYPVLIIAPKSTLAHWEKEFHRWAKLLNIIIYQGEKMSRRCIQKHELYSSVNGVLFDAIITNYELVLLDDSLLRKFKWSAIIIDEAHKIKNLDCKLGGCLKQLDAEFRLLLTGTPLQNTLLELFALLHFLDPEEFSDPRERAESFSTIGMNMGDSHSLGSDMKVSQIHDLLQPRMLRRMKSEVLFSSMPAKKWVEVPCALSSSQRDLYVNLLKKNYEELNKRLVNGRKLVLNFLLMELRKCCNHPYLIPGQEPLNLSREEALSDLVTASGKLQLLEKLLPKLKARGNRVLLFSQMTRMLDILEDFLIFLGLTYFRIDGETNASARQQQIQEFNNPECEVFIFLISTRAGGLGIDLPSADRVIIYDPDFNPFIDLQAQSRAHRIGQSRPVVVYQLITKCSVEEKILEKSKRKLAIENLVMNPKTKLDVKELHSVLLHGARKILSKKSMEATSFDYDDNAIETLFSMDPKPGEKYVAEENGYLGGIQSFIPLPEQEPNSPPKANQWSELLAECKSDAPTIEDFGRGKRHKSAVKYFQEDPELSEELKEVSDNDTEDEEQEEYAPEDAGESESSSDDSSDGDAPDQVEATGE